jgi:hypothetical protein
MKKCPDCGKEYSDDTAVCPSDRVALVLPEVARQPEQPRQHTIVIRRFTAGSTFKLVAIGCIISLFGFCLLMGFFALFGAHTVHWNREYLTGTSGLIASVLFGGALVIAYMLIGWLGFTISFWIFSKFSTLKLHYIADKDPSRPNETEPRS